MNAGVFRIPMADYVADKLCDVPSLSSGCAFKILTQSPRHAFADHPKLGGRIRNDSGVADIGSLAHDLLLGGEGKICEIDPNDHPAEKTGNIPDGWTNKSIRAARDLARSNGLIPVLTGDMIGVKAMVRAAKDYIADSHIAGFLDEGESELTVISQENETYLRTRPDWLNSRISLSYKTTRGRCTPDKFEPLAKYMGYWFALAFYERALKPQDEYNGQRHLILVQEQLAPWGCHLYEPSKAMQQIERNQVERAVSLWAKCRAENRWPGYPGNVVVVEPRPWDLAAEEARLVEEEMEAMESS